MTTSGISTLSHTVLIHNDKDPKIVSSPDKSRILKIFECSDVLEIMLPYFSAKNVWDLRNISKFFLDPTKDYIWRSFCSRIWPDFKEKYSLQIEPKSSTFSLDFLRKKLSWAFATTAIEPHEMLSVPGLIESPFGGETSPIYQILSFQQFDSDTLMCEITPFAGISFWNVNTKRKVRDFGGKVGKLIIVGEGRYIRVEADYSITKFDAVKKSKPVVYPRLPFPDVRILRRSDVIELDENHLAMINQGPGLLVLSSDPKEKPLSIGDFNANLLTKLSSETVAFIKYAKTSDKSVAQAWKTKITVYNIKTKTEISKESHLTITALTSLNEFTLISGSSKGDIIISDIRTDKDRILLGHKDQVNAIVIINKDLIASGSNDGTIRVWDVRSGETIRVLQANGNNITNLSASKEKHLIAQEEHLDIETTIRVWDIKTA